MVLNTLVSITLAASLFLPTDHTQGGGEKDPTMDIVELAASSGSFNTLVQAIKAAGLVETLSGQGPFTVFAPTDEAFARIPQADLEALLADKPALTSVLTYHVIPGRVYAKDVVNLSSAETINGQSVQVLVRDGRVLIDEATVIATDLAATNGIIHVIDRVILPEM